jgi:multiple sugar transport system ATP-binding protein
MASISVESACRTFTDGTRALDGVSLGVADGEFLVLVGPSGCGKSTLLRAVAGLETLDGGRVLIGDADVTARPAGERDIAMVFQSYALYPQMTVRDNIEFGLKSRGMRASERQERVADVAALLGLASLLSRRPAGAVRRAAAARRHGPRDRAPAPGVPDGRAAFKPGCAAALVHARRACPHARAAQGHDDLRHARPGRGDDAGRTGSRDAGRARSSNATRRASSSTGPCNVFVATFMGSPPMNLLKASVTAGGLRFGRYELPLESGIRIPDAFPSTLLMGLRPGDLALDRSAPGHWPRIEVVPHAIEEYGHERIVRFRCDAPSDTSTDIEVSALLSGRDAITVGERLRLGVDPAHLHFFDPDSGNAVT